MCIRECECDGMLLNIHGTDCKMSGWCDKILTSDPLAQAATKALHAIDGLFGCVHRSPCSRDINSNAGVDPWHSYKMICCIYGWNPFDAESNTGSYYSCRNKHQVAIVVVVVACVMISETNQI